LRAYGRPCNSFERNVGNQAVIRFAPVGYIHKIFCRGNQIRISGSTRTSRKNWIFIHYGNPAKRGVTAVYRFGINIRSTRSVCRNGTVLADVCNKSVIGIPEDFFIQRVFGKHRYAEQLGIADIHFQICFIKLNTRNGDDQLGIYVPIRIIVRRNLTKIGVSAIGIRVYCPDSVEIVTNESFFFLCLRIGNLLRRICIAVKIRGVTADDHVFIPCTVMRVNTVFSASRICGSECTEIKGILTGCIGIHGNSGNPCITRRTFIVRINISIVIAVGNDGVCSSGYTASLQGIIAEGIGADFAVIAALARRTVHDVTANTACECGAVSCAVRSIDISLVARIAYVGVFINGSRDSPRTRFSALAVGEHLTVIFGIFYDVRTFIGIISAVKTGNTAGISVISVYGA